MIGYAPLDPLDEPGPRRPPPPGPGSVLGPPKQAPGPTECNYLVMFFIVGVLGLAIQDMMRK
jgi:hypothetical protein